MYKTVNGPEATGRANAVLVFGSSDSAVACLTSVIVRICPLRDAGRLRFSGPVQFSAKTVNHILDVILPLAFDLLKPLGLNPPCIEVSVANIDPASINDLGVNIFGFSIDVSLFMAILSACTGIFIPSSTVFTGHIASKGNGELRIVKELPAKLAVAVKTDSINCFVHPALNQDSSLGLLSPLEKQKTSEAISQAQNEIKTVAVSHIDALLRTVLNKEQILMASLKRGFFKPPDHDLGDETACQKATRFLALYNEKRFWAVLEHHLIGGRSDDANKLLLALTRYHVDHATYFSKFGRKLLRLVQSVPPATRRLKIKFPLLPLSEAAHLCRFAKDENYRDIPLLYKAILGETYQSPQNFAQNHKLSKQDRADDNRLLDSLLSEIDADVLLPKIGSPIDSARASYVMDAVVIDSSEAFHETISAFYLHLQRYTETEFAPCDSKSDPRDAMNLLEEAFIHQGGYQAALAEAKFAINGGLRYVFDKMTDQFKREEYEKHVNFILKSFLKPLEWEDRVAVIKEIMTRFSAYLPAEVLSQPPEQFIKHLDTIVKAIVQFIDRVKSLFRSL